MFEPNMLEKLPPAPARKSRWLPIVVAGVVALLCVGGGVAAWMLNAAGNSTAEVRSTAVEYIENIKAGNFDAAYAMLCPETKSRISMTAFRGVHKPISGYEVTGVEVTVVNGILRGMVSTRLTLADGSQSDQSFPLLKEHGKWWICDS